MIQLRCRNNRLLGEVDPETLSFRVPCKTCTSVWGHPVFHLVPIDKALNAVRQGRRDGVLLVDSDIPEDATDTR